MILERLSEQLASLINEQECKKTRTSQICCPIVDVYGKNNYSTLVNPIAEPVMEQRSGGVEKKAVRQLM